MVEIVVGQPANEKRKIFAMCSMCFIRWPCDLRYNTTFEDENWERWLEVGEADGRFNQCLVPLS